MLNYWQSHYVTIKMYIFFQVRDLRIELTENKNITKDIIESYNAKYEKSELKSSEERELLSSNQKKTNYSTNYV